MKIPSPIISTWVVAIGSVLLLQPAFSQESEPILVEDPGWPRVIETEGHRLTVFQPQIDSWESYAIMKGKIAISVTLAGSEVPVYGAILLTAPTTVSIEDRTVLLGKRRVSKIEFPGQGATELLKLKAIVSSVASPDKPIVVSLDRVLASVDRAQNQEKDIEVNLDPPPIFHSTEPAILVTFLGEPRMEVIPDTNLLFAANTNWEVFLHIGSSQYYLLNGDHWLTTSDPKAPWKPAASLPDDFKKLPDSEEWAEVRKYLSAPAVAAAPRVFYSDRPAELILTDGKPNLGLISGTKLLNITNSESDVFLNSVDAHYYFLAAGRWFKSKTLEGPWLAATKSLPTDFAAIPHDHSTAVILASVPGTPEADEAILMASIPKKATVKRTEAKLDVAYDGEPKFVLIEGTDSVEFAQNTAFQVFRVNGNYFCCHEGIWFISASPSGPWAVSSKVPDAIYQIPPSSPHHNVSYVYVYDSNPDEVTVGYTSGYEGSYVVGDVLLFGLGVWAISEIADNHWWGYHHHHAHWFSYGCGVHYNHYTGVWGRGWNHCYGPHGGAGRYATYNATTGTFKRGAVRYGPGGAAFARQAYNPGTGTWGAQAGYRSPYKSWGRSAVTRDDEWLRAGHYREGSRMVAGFETSKGTAAVGTRTAFGNSVVAKKGDDVFVGKNGNLYRKDQDGATWQKMNEGKWQSSDNLKVDRTEVKSKIAEVDRSKVKQNLSARTETIKRPAVQSTIANRVQTPRVSTPVARPATPYRGSSSSSYGSGISGQLNRDSYSRDRGNYRSSQSSSGFRSGSRSSGGFRSSGGGRRRR